MTRILCVDDEPMVLRTMARLAEANHYDVVCANGGVEALASFDKSPGSFDMVITDLKMEPMDGYEFARQIRQRSQTIPIVAASGFSGPKTQGRLSELGFNELMPKPYGLETFHEIVERWTIHSPQD
jgi:CheY-like chemotaxis protein